MKLFNLSLEEVTDDTTDEPIKTFENEGSLVDEDVFPEENSMEENEEDFSSDMDQLIVSTNITETLSRKAEANDGEISDEEIIIATEAIGHIFSKAKTQFNGFGFEQYAGRTLTQKEKTEIALEAITNQNNEKADAAKAKVENFFNGLSTYSTWFSGNTKKLNRDAYNLLKRVENADEASFGKTPITDRRVMFAFQRGVGNKPFSSYKDILKALKGNIDSLKVLSVTSKYKNRGSGKGSEFDLEKLAENLSGIVESRTADSTTFNINPNLLNGVKLLLTVPNDSDSGYFARNFKANFKILTTSATAQALQTLPVKALTKKEALEVLKETITHIRTQETIFKIYYQDAKLSILDSLKIFIKGVIASTVVSLAVSPIVGKIAMYTSLTNNFYFRFKIQSMNSKLHYINQRTIRGVLALVASSID